VISDSRLAASVEFREPPRHVMGKHFNRSRLPASLLQVNRGSRTRQLRVGVAAGGRGSWVVQPALVRKFEDDGDQPLL
jgi:hypothetical protein